MVLPDVNVLVYAHRPEAADHHRYRGWLDEVLRSDAPYGVADAVLTGFVRIVTHPRIFKTPTPLAKAIDQVDAWLESPQVSLLTESGRHWATLRSLLRTARVVGPQVHDARVAALCLQHGVRELWTADRDFGRFAELRAVNPLVTTG